jgi:hypothetical protein
MPAVLASNSRSIMSILALNFDIAPKLSSNRCFDRAARLRKDLICVSNEVLKALRSRSDFNMHLEIEA